MSDFIGEQSRVHIMPISAKWKHKSSIHIGFIVFNGGVTTFFAKSVCCNSQRIPVLWFITNILEIMALAWRMWVNLLVTALNKTQQI